MTELTTENRFKRALQTVRGGSSGDYAITPLSTAASGAVQQSQPGPPKMTRISTLSLSLPQWNFNFAGRILEAGPLTRCGQGSQDLLRVLQVQDIYDPGHERVRCAVFSTEDSDLSRIEPMDVIYGFRVHCVRHVRYGMQIQITPRPELNWVLRKSWDPLPPRHRMC
ncbi:hypothetical protein BGZ83_004782 [Gryganskiella cystojenkinii]|nr:hypothetical protein BGZ83_004782 [Gryganskiella cystojenkinii]